MPGTGGKRGTRTKVQVPKLDPDEFEIYLADINVWKKLCGLPKNEQGMMLWYNLPSKHPSDIKAKMFNKICVEELEKEDRAKTFVEAMEKAFKTEDEVKSLNSSKKCEEKTENMRLYQPI